YYEVSDDELSVVGMRSGERISLGDGIEVEVEDVSVLRRTVYGRRVALGEERAEYADEPRRVRRTERRSRPTARSDAGRAAQRAGARRSAARAGSKGKATTAKRAASRVKRGSKRSRKGR